MRKYFITGLFVLLPLVVTLYVLFLGFSIVDGILGTIIARVMGRNIHGAGTVLTLALIFATGVFATNVIGRKIIFLGETVFLHIPIVRNIYQGVKQLLDAFSNSTSKEAFKRVVMLEYPRKDVYSIAFLTSESSGEIQARTHKNCVTVFVPTTPNPTSGFFLVVPSDQCTYLDMSVEEAFKLIISGGVIVPSWKG